MDIISGGAGAYLDISGSWGFPTWLWIILLVIGLAIAPFWAFHKVRVGRDKLQKKLDDRKERKVILDFLAERKDSIFYLYHKEIKSKEELEEWLKDTQAWVTKTQDDIDKFLTPVDASIFRDVSGGLFVSYSRSFNREHNSELNTIVRLSKNLEKIIDRYPSVLVND